MKNDQRDSLMSLSDLFNEVLGGPGGLGGGSLFALAALSLLQKVFVLSG